MGELKIELSKFDGTETYSAGNYVVNSQEIEQVLEALEKHSNWAIRQENWPKSAINYLQNDVYIRLDMMQVVKEKKYVIDTIISKEARLNFEDSLPKILKEIFTSRRPMKFM